MNYVYSQTDNCFYAVSEKAAYEASGTWPADGKAVDDEVFYEYSSAPPEGKRRGADSNGLPVWVDIPAQPNAELLKIALTRLGTEYQTDIEALNRAWLAAAVNDGVNETTKKNSVLSQITARKAKYATDRAAVIAQYPV